MKAFVLIPILLVSFTFVNPCSPKSRYATKAPATGDKVYDVDVIYPKFFSKPRIHRVEGTFDVSERQKITASGDGSIEQVFINVGDRVEAEDPVVSINNQAILDKLEMRRLKIKELNSRLRQAEGNFDTLETEDRPVTNEEVGFLDDDDIMEEEPVKKPFGPAEKKEPTTLKGLVELLEARIEFYSKELQVLDRQLLGLTHGSPANGTVSEILVSEGNAVKAGAPLVEIAQMDPMSVAFELPQSVASFIDKHSKVKVTPKDARDVIGEGTVYYISPDVDPENKTISVKAHVSNTEFSIRGGQTADVEVITRKVDKVLGLPNEAVVYEGDKTFVFIKQGYQARLLEVEVGRELDGGLMEVRADIRVDDAIIVNRPVELENDDFVKVRKKIPIRPVLPTNPQAEDSVETQEETEENTEE